MLVGLNQETRKGHKGLEVKKKVEGYYRR